MGKIILEFDSVEEARDALTAMNGYKWKMAIHELDQELRETTKYSKSLSSYDGEATETEIVVAGKVRERIRRILDNYGLNLID